MKLVMHKLDIVMTIILLIAYIPLSILGANQYSSIRESLQIAMVIVGAAYVIWMGIRYRSPIICAVLGALIPLATFGPVLAFDSFTENLDVMFCAIYVLCGALAGFSLSTFIRWSLNLKPIRTTEDKDVSDLKTDKQQLIGIEGWLVIPAIGLILNPIISIVLVITKLDYKHRLSYRDLVEHYVGYSAFYNFGILIECLFLFFVLITCYLFFRRKKSTPKVVVSYLIARLVVSGIHFLWGILLLSVSDPLVTISLLRSTGLIGFVIAAGILIPYFKISKRVKATFTE
jgi:hypothetical protein